MGRSVDGDAPTAPAAPNTPPRNDFDYGGDSKGALCPFQSHVRRANPRTPNRRASAAAPYQPRVARIMRRGMSYGPRFEDQPEDERGVVFMAYNASLAEQFEVVQRWISGGNSSGVFSGHSDPLLGVPQVGDARTFCFQDTDAAGAPVLRRIALNDPSVVNPRPFVKLEWGTYLFVPSMTALATLLAEPPQPATARPQPAPEPWPVDEGERIVLHLIEMEKRVGASAKDM